MDTVILVLGGLGFLLSVYALWVRAKAVRNPAYRSLCDFSENISCSKAFSSKEGMIFMMPNPAWGIFFYAAILVWGWLEVSIVLFVLSIIGVLVSIYLAYVLYVKQKNFCLVCTTIYIINLLLYVFSWM